MSNKPEYLTWSSEKNKSVLLSATANQALNLPVIKRSMGRTEFQNIAPNTSIREGYTRTDYEYYRRNEKIPTRKKEIIRACMAAYRRIGLIRNVIDLMSDFAVQGIKLVHPNKTIQRFHEEWERQVHFKERSERFVNLLFRTANTIVQRQTAVLSDLDVKKMRSAIATTHLTGAAGRVEIPWSYSFLNPLAVELENEEAALFFGLPKQYVLGVPNKIAGYLRNPRNATDSNLDEYDKTFAGGRKIRLNPDKVSVWHYKKDDWEAWADPMIYAILDDLILFEKLKLADLSALDGAISHIRIWKLGSLEHKIVPNDAVMGRLSEMLLSNLSGGALDLIWGPDIELLETGTDIYQFLGQEKYGPALNSIYAGLGIPPTLTGAATSSGFTNNFISLKTLIERLSYARCILTQFWKQELKLIQKTLGFRFSADIIYDRMNLSDEAAEKALLIQLADRDLISVETLQHRFGEHPDLERLRMRRETRERKKNKLPLKASPWHNPQPEEKLKAIFAQTGTVTPSQVGIELLPKKSGEKPALDMKSKPVNTNLPGQPSPGRPVNSKDSQKRKQKRVLPRSKADLVNILHWTKTAQIKIADLLNNGYLSFLNKKNLRQLTDAEVAEYEQFKFSVLCNMEPFTEINEKNLADLLQKPLVVPEFAEQLKSSTVHQFAQKFEREPTIDDKRLIEVNVYAVYQEYLNNPEGTESNGDTESESEHGNEGTDGNGERGNRG